MIEIQCEAIELDYLTNDLGVWKRDGSLLVRVAVFSLGNPAIAEMPFTQWQERRKAYHPLLGQKAA
jgi:hypothetical protein